MYASHPWLSAPPGPPPYSVQNPQAQAQVPAPAPAGSTSQAYILTLSILPVPAGHPLPPPPPNYPQLVPTAIQYHGLPVYGPVLQPAPPDSLPPTIPSITHLSIGTPKTASQSPEPRKPRVIFHMLNHATIGFGDDFIANCQEEKAPQSLLGKHQCLSLKKNFPHMKDVRHVLCSPDTRALLTAHWVFKDHITRVVCRPMIPWDDLCECPSKEQYPLNPKKLPKLHQGQSLGLGVIEKLRMGSGSSAFLTNDPSKVPVKYYWQNHVDNENERDERADRVRFELYNLAKLPFSGGKWKDIYIPKCKATESGGKHIVIISHANFLNLLTHRADLKPEDAT